MRFDVDRMGEHYRDVTDQWLASIVTVREMLMIKGMTLGDKLTFKRDVSGPVGKQKNLVITRTA